MSQTGVSRRIHLLDPAHYRDAMPPRQVGEQASNEENQLTRFQDVSARIAPRRLTGPIEWGRTRDVQLP